MAQKNQYKQTVFKIVAANDIGRFNNEMSQPKLFSIKMTDVRPYLKFPFLMKSLVELECFTLVLLLWEEGNGRSHYCGL